MKFFVDTKLKEIFQFSKKKSLLRVSHLKIKLQTSNMSRQISQEEFDPFKPSGLERKDGKSIFQVRRERRQNFRGQQQPQQQQSKRKRVNKRVNLPFDSSTLKVTMKETITLSDLMRDFSDRIEAVPIELQSMSRDLEAYEEGEELNTEALERRQKTIRKTLSDYESFRDSFEKELGKVKENLKRKRII